VTGSKNLGQPSDACSLISPFCFFFPVTEFVGIAFIRVAPMQEPSEGETMISAKVELTQPLSQQRQFVARTGSEHHFLLDDAAGGSGPKPIELVAAGLAGCTAFDVITILRQKYHQKVTGYEVRVEADQAERPPQVFTAVRIHHVVRGFDIDASAIEQAIHLSEEKYCSVGAMVQKTASFHTTFEIVAEKTDWLNLAEPAATQA
jgi:putative redox protein